MSGNFLTGNPRCPICSGHHPINAPCFLSTNWIPLEKTPMTTDIKELVRGRELRATLAERDDLMRRLRGQHRAIRSGYLKGLFLAAADALEAMAGEVERLKLANIHPLIMRAEKAEAENARLKGALEALAGERDAWEKAAREHLDWRERNRERANAAEAERDRLKAALETIAHDNVPREVFIVWRTDGSNSKHDKCQHMRMMYEDCGNCTALFARKALGDAS